MIAIRSDGDNVDNAHKFLDFLMEPQVIAGITNYVSYPNGNADAMQYVDEKIRNDKAYLHHGGKPIVAVWGIGFSDSTSFLSGFLANLVEEVHR